MYCTILTHPFAPLAPATLLAAIRGLQALVTNCWPRVAAGVWRDEIIRALMLCWLGVGGAGGEPKSATEEGAETNRKNKDGAGTTVKSGVGVRDELVLAARLLDAAMR